MKLSFWSIVESPYTDIFIIPIGSGFIQHYLQHCQGLFNENLNSYGLFRNNLCYMHD
jgi:hypothetical protein